ncbi:MAG: GLPGLI family protein [Prevotella sp.]|nr:GLPGLI family protein [Prevotella sp.]MBR0049278.1 GLPGLI family protein [Prevotella sp.]
MKKILVTMMAFALTIAARAEKIDSTQFVAFYNYTLQTQDEEGQNVTDSIRLALLVGTRATYCTTVLSYNKDGRASQEMTNAFLMHHQNVLTDVERSEVVAVEPIYPYRYETHDPLAKIDWTLTEDTLTVSGLLCHRATGKIYGKQWTAWYTEEMPSSAGPWKLRGLPGLIIKAEDSEEIHCFTLYETKNEVRDINAIGNSEYQKLSRQKLMKFKKKTLGNARYPKEPTYYVPKGADDVAEVNLNGTMYYVGMNSHMMLPQKSHVYKPLELE